MTTRIPRLVAASLLVAVVLSPGIASAGDCNANISPSPGWRGAIVTISGSGFPPGAGYYVNFGGNQIHNGTTDTSGGFSFQYQIPNDFPVGTTQYFVADNDATCEVNPSYTVNAGPPVTTTTPTTTTTTAPTTTQATTTTAATTTTTAATTTTSPVDDTTTTTEADDDDDGGGGISPIVWVLIALVVVLAVALAFALGRIRRT